MVRSIAPLMPADDRVPSRRVVASLDAVARRRDDRRQVEADAGGTVTPALLQLATVLDGRLGVARAKRDCAQALRTQIVEFRLGGGEDLGSTRAERLHRLPRHPGDFECAMFSCRRGLVTERLDVGLELGVIDRSEQRVVRPELVVMQRVPLAIGALGGVGDDGVDMRLRVEIAVGVVLEQRDDEVAGLDRLGLAVLPFPRFGEVLFGPRERCLDRRHVGREQPFVAADIGEQRYRLWVLRTSCPCRRGDCRRARAGAPCRRASCPREFS